MFRISAFRVSVSACTLSALLVGAPGATAQNPAPAPPASAAATTPPANPADVASIDAILAALYDVISGPAGQTRNWDRMRSLFVPGARLNHPGGPWLDPVPDHRAVLEAVIAGDPDQAEAAMRYALRESDSDLRAGEPPFEGFDGSQQAAAS